MTQRDDAVDRVANELMFHEQRSNETYGQFARRLLDRADGKPPEWWPTDAMLDETYGPGQWGEQRRRTLGQVLRAAGVQEETRAAGPVCPVDVIGRLSDWIEENFEGAQVYRDNGLVVT